MKPTSNLNLLAIFIWIFILGSVSHVATGASKLPPECTNPTNGGVIGTDQSDCSPFDPNELTNESLPSGQIGILEYKWQSSVSPYSVWVDILSNTATYTPGTLTETTKFKRIARVNCKTDWIGAAESNAVTITVIQDVADAGPITGSTVLITGASGVPYSVAAINHADSYIWEYSGTGVTINGDGPSITLDFEGDATPGDLTVFGMNDCGSGNSSSLTIQSGISLNLKVFLEGPLDSGTGLMNTDLNSGSFIPIAQPFNIAPWNYSGTESVASIPYSDIVDWILVELRESDAPENATSATIIGSRAAFLKSDGTIVDMDGVNPVQFPDFTLTGGNNLYVVIRHQNHLAIMSASGATLNAGTYSYDFTTGLSQVYGGGNGYKQVGSTVAMVSGDVDKDGNVFVSDFNNWAVEFGTTGGYLNSDLDLDGNAFVSDYNKWAVNFGSQADDMLKSAQLNSGQPKPKYSSRVPR